MFTGGLRNGPSRDFAERQYPATPARSASEPWGASWRALLARLHD